MEQNRMKAFFASDQQVKRCSFFRFIRDNQLFVSTSIAETKYQPTEFRQQNDIIFRNIAMRTMIERI